MGKFIYGATLVSVELDDRLLAHLRVALVTKLRRSEAFMFHVDVGGGNGRRSFWIHPAVPIQFHFDARTGQLNPRWIEQMVILASGVNGLDIPPEPTDHPSSGPQ